MVLVSVAPLIDSGVPPPREEDTFEKGLVSINIVSLRFDMASSKKPRLSLSMGDSEVVVYV